MASTGAKKTKRATSAAALAAQVADASVLFNTDPSPFCAAVDKKAAKLVVVTGENASGKSLFVRVMAAVSQQEKILPVSVSIRERTGAGLHEMAGMRKMFMFGDETDQSSGATSVKVVKTAFNNLDRPGGSMLILDEPEIGLSAGYARALGQFIGQQTGTVPAKCRGVVVVTHSRELVQGLTDGFDKIPTHAAITAEQPAQAGLGRWLQETEHRTVDDLFVLQDVALDRWRRVNKIINT